MFDYISSIPLDFTSIFEMPDLLKCFTEISVTKNGLRTLYSLFRALQKSGVNTQNFIFEKILKCTCKLLIN